MRPLSETVHKDLTDVLTGEPGARPIPFGDALAELARIADSRRTVIETMGREDERDSA